MRQNKDYELYYVFLFLINFFDELANLLISACFFSKSEILPNT